MAHVLAHAKKGPRAVDAPDMHLEGYENLILLCPNHHALIDKAPTDYPAEMLRKWKTDLENRIASALDVPTFSAKSGLYKYAEQLLSENRFIHSQFGPASEIAHRNPISNSQQIWEARKIEQVIPNNARVVAAFKRYQHLLSPEELAIFNRFEAHAVAFAASAEDPLDSAPVFPVEFADMIKPKEG